MDTEPDGTASVGAETEWGEQLAIAPVEDHGVDSGSFRFHPCGHAGSRTIGRADHGGESLGIGAGRFVFERLDVMNRDE